jgi:hypothetical protein
MAERAIGADGVAIAATIPAAGQVSGRFDVSDDQLHRPLGQAGGGDVARPGVRSCGRSPPARARARSAASTDRVAVLKCRIRHIQTIAPTVMRSKFA